LGGGGCTGQKAEGIQGEGQQGGGGRATGRHEVKTSRRNWKDKHNAEKVKMMIVEV
jgi:hypothetical protein